MSWFNQIFGIKEDHEVKKVQAGHSLTQLIPGSVVKLALIGKDLSDFEFLVEHVHEHCIGENYYWLEYEGKNLSNGQSLSLEVDEDQDLVITLSGMFPQQRLHEIHTSPEDLERIDEEGRGTLQYQGMPYYYEDSDEVCMLIDGQEHRERWYYYWDFVSSDQKSVLTVERLGRNDYQVIFSYKLNRNQVQLT